MNRLVGRGPKLRACLFLALAGVGFFLGERLARGETIGPPGPVILIDPGHGGFDGGCGRRTALLEKDLNLAVARQLARSLGRFRLCPAMTRDDDRHLGPTHRKDLLARVEMARIHRADVVVCLHADWSWDRRRRGPCVFYHRTAGDSRRLAHSIQTELNRAAGSQNAALPAGDLLVIREVKRPAVLIEMGFLSHPEEGARLAEPAYQEALAEAITIGLINFLLPAD